MSRSKTRERRRRERIETELRKAVVSARKVDAKAAKSRLVTPGNGKLWRLLREIERSGLCVWAVARAIRCTEDEIAMIAQAVAPLLAGMTRKSVLRFREQSI